MMLLSPPMVETSMSSTPTTMHPCSKNAYDWRIFSSEWKLNFVSSGSFVYPVGEPRRAEPPRLLDLEPQDAGELQG
jgi:hypothetical protein